MIIPQETIDACSERMIKGFCSNTGLDAYHTVILKDAEGEYKRFRVQDLIRHAFKFGMNIANELQEQENNKHNDTTIR